MTIAYIKNFMKMIKKKYKKLDKFTKKSPQQKNQFKYLSFVFIGLGVMQLPYMLQPAAAGSARAAAAAAAQQQLPLLTLDGEPVAAPGDGQAAAAALFGRFATGQTLKMWAKPENS